VRYVLDANIAIAALNNIGTVQRHLETVPGSEVGIPMVAVAELLFGAHKSKRREENLQRVAALRRSVATLALTDGVIERYGATRADLESRGLIKSDFDLIIACTAVDLDAVLVTSDQALLDGSISGLRTENWLA
jgi:predicted nucleic acid-binding protein